MRTGKSSGVRRWAQGIGALLVLVAGLVGVPWLLVRLAGNPLPDDVGLDQVWRVLSSPDDGTVLVGIVVVVCWIAWLVFALSVITESVTIATRHRIRLPGLGGAQRAAGTLIIFVVAMIAAPHQLSLAEPVNSDEAVASAPAIVEPRAGEHSTKSAADSPQPEWSGLRHRVESGDDLWSLAERYYGNGQQWRRISTANPEILTGGPDRLGPGWVLKIPGVDAERPRLQVAAGETLSSIAEREYGDPSAWERIYQANRSQISDPDLVPAGIELVLPAAREDESERARSDRQATDHADDVSRERSEPSRSEREPAGPKQDEPGPERSRTPSALPGSPSALPGSPSARPSSPTFGPSSAASSGAGERTGATASPAAGIEDPATVGTGATASPGEHAVGVAVGGLLAAGLIGGLAARRRMQLQLRPVGRRIPHPPVVAQQVETGLGRRQEPMTRRRLDLALRAIGRDCRARGRSLPSLQTALLTGERLILTMAEDDQPAPVGFAVEGRRWMLSRTDADYFGQDSELASAPQPYPGLTCLGTTSEGAALMVNLESAGMLSLSAGGDADRRAGVIDGAICAAVAELAFSPWTDELVLSVVGDDHGLVSAIDGYNVHGLADLDQLLDRWEPRAALQREQLTTDPTAATDRRIDPDLADSWVLEIAFITAPPNRSQTARLQALLVAEPRPTLAAVVVGASDTTDWKLRLDSAEGGSAELVPGRLHLRPQVIMPPLTESLRQLIECTGTEQTDRAPWWSAVGEGPADGPPSAAEDDQESGPDARPSWPSAAARRPSDAPSEESVESGPVARPDEEFEGVDRPARATGRRGVSEEYTAVPSPREGPGPVRTRPPTPRHPTIMLLGPVELVGTTGRAPNRALLQCIEYCTWLLEHPGCTAQAMAAGLVVAEGTRRSNMSRLRTWLGVDDCGEPYLPDAYSGRIMLSPLVSSDWHRLQIVTAAGINRSSTPGLCRALDLVRGAPLADTAPGQWHGAEEMRTDMVSVIRDIGVELATRALAGADVDLARWAAARSLTAAPHDELLIGMRIRTEYQAGNAAEVERLALQLSAHTRSLGVDLLPETVDLLQRVLEGGLRARA